MTSVERAKSMACMQIEEARSTARIRKAYTAIIVSNAQSLYPIFQTQQQRQLLSEALKDKDTDNSMLLRGLLLQLNGAFENFIRLLCTAIVETKSAHSATYSAIDERLRRDHLHHSATILTHQRQGHVNGLKYDFGTLKTSLAKCLLDAADFKVQSDVFTFLMGNCTSGRLTELFKSLSLQDPFSDSLGQNPSLKEWANDRSNRRVSNAAKSALDDHISLRNDIAHGNLTKTVSDTEFESCATFFGALIEALSDKVSTELQLS